MDKKDLLDDKKVLHLFCSHFHALMHFEPKRAHIFLATSLLSSLVKYPLEHRKKCLNIMINELLDLGNIVLESVEDVNNYNKKMKKKNPYNKE